MSEVQVPKKMTPKEFYELGYLQELNRQFLHPLGMALEVVIDDETGDVSFGKVWDYRDDPEGMQFALEEYDARTEQEVLEMRAKAERIMAEQANKAQTRVERLGYVTQDLYTKRELAEAREAYEEAYRKDKLGRGESIVRGRGSKVT